jgi:hypothetical protein
MLARTGKDRASNQVTVMGSFAPLDAKKVRSDRLVKTLLPASNLPNRQLGLFTLASTGKPRTGLEF